MDVAQMGIPRFRDGVIRQQPRMNGRHRYLVLADGYPGMPQSVWRPLARKQLDLLHIQFRFADMAGLADSREHPRIIVAIDRPGGFAIPTGL